MAAPTALAAQMGCAALNCDAGGFEAVAVFVANILAAQFGNLTEPQTAPRRNQHQRPKFRFDLVRDGFKLLHVGHDRLTLALTTVARSMLHGLLTSSSSRTAVSQTE